MTRRQTIQKQAVLNAVRAAQPTHPTAADIFAAVRPSLPTLSFGTVYRVLHGLTSEGVILEVPQSNGPTRYDGDTSFHHHILCLECGAVGDVHLDADFLMESCGRPQTEFQIAGYRLEFHGFCPACCDAQRREQTPDPQRTETPC